MDGGLPFTALYIYIFLVKYSVSFIALLTGNGKWIRPNHFEEDILMFGQYSVAVFLIIQAALMNLKFFEYWTVKSKNELIYQHTKYIHKHRGMSLQVFILVTKIFVRWAQYQCPCTQFLWEQSRWLRLSDILVWWGYTQNFS